MRAYLASHQEYRVVFLLPERDYKKYPQLFGDGYNNLFFVEPVNVSNSKGFIQKLFYFFYSYLLYTNTTWMLATMGTRPDEPPAGGSMRRMLNPVKRAIAATFGKSLWVRRCAVPAMFWRVFRERPFQNVFDSYQPDLVFVSHIYGWFDTNLLAEAKQRHIKTMGMPAGWDHLDKYFLPFPVDRMLAQSSWVKHAAIKYQSYKDEEVFIIGYPNFDYIASRVYEMPRADLLQKLNFPADAKLILYVSGSVYCPDEPDIIEEMVKWAERGELAGNVYFVIRLYPRGRQGEKDFDERKFERLKSSSRVAFYLPEAWDDKDASKFLLNLILHADIMIQVYTTMALEATVLQRPLLSTPFDGYQKRPRHRSLRRFEKFEHFQDIIKSGALASAYNFDELKMYINRYLEDPQYGAKERRELRKNFCGPLDGHNSDRLVERIIEFVSES